MQRVTKRGASLNFTISVASLTIQNPAAYDERLGGARFAPRPKVDSVQNDAEQISWNKTPLRGPYSYNANYDAIDSSEPPTFPTSPPHKNRRKNGQRTRQVIKPQHQRLTSAQSL